MPTNFQINGQNFDDLFIPKAPFSEGGLWGWGYNLLGQLGDNTTAARSSPVQTVTYGTNWKQVSVGREHTAAVKTDGTLWLWGHNDYGELGAGFAGPSSVRSSPIQTVTYGTNWKDVTCGNFMTSAIKADGTLWLWGHNPNGQLGTNDITHRSSPIQTITYGTNWKQCSNGYKHTAAVKTDGTLWLWGHNDYGQLGTNDRTARSSPIQTVAYGTNWKQVACGNYFTAAVKTDGTLWLWGRNYNSGNLGTNDVIDRSSPIQTVAYGANWKSVECGDDHTLAIKTDGTLWVWGTNDNGELGINTNDWKSSPIQTVTYGTNWKQVSSAGVTSGAIKNDGTLWMWGRNTYGGLGVNNTIQRSSPIQTIAYGTNWKQISVGSLHTAAVKDDGLIY